VLAPAGRGGPACPLAHSGEHPIPTPPSCPAPPRPAGKLTNPIDAVALLTDLNKAAPVDMAANATATNTTKMPAAAPAPSSVAGLSASALAAVAALAACVAM
jgi:hypothetical protein